MVPVGDRRRRRRVDPGAVVVLRAVRPQAPARPGDHRSAPAPVVGAGRGRPADPQRGRQRAGLRRHPRQPADRPVPRRRRRAVRRGRRSRAGRLRIGWSVQAADARRAQRPGARARRRGHRAPARRPRPRRARDRRRTTPTRRSRSCRSSSPASAPRPTRSSTTTGSSGAPARPTASGPGCVPACCDWALRRTETYSARLNRVFDDVDVLLTPVTAHRPPALGIVMGKGTVRSSLASLPTVTYQVPWNVAGNPAAVGAVRDRRRRPAGRRPARRPHRRRGDAVQPCRRSSRRRVPARVGPRRGFEAATQA